MNFKTILIFVSIAWISHAQSKELVACIDDHPPYQILAEKPYGLHITALEILADILNKELEFVKSPNFARCIALLKTGQVDVIAGLGESNERKKFAFFAPFKSADALRVLSTKDITINSYDDFKGKIIGVTRGTVYFPRFDQDKQLKKITIQNVRIALSMLLKGRIDMIMLSPANLQTFAKEIREAKLTVSPITLEEMRNKVTAFGFSKAHNIALSDQEILTKIDQAYRQGRFNNK